MQETLADHICRQLDGSERHEPFGPGTVVWTVRGHMFAAYIVDGEGVSLRLDCAQALRLVAEGRADAPPWLRQEGWVTLPWDTHPEELRRRILGSYGLVRLDRNSVVLH
jgi:hypothetical protein